MKTKRVPHEQIANQIVTQLFRTFNGKSYTKGNRIAVMAGKWPNERPLGGWCREAAAKEIVAVLANHL